MSVRATNWAWEQGRAGAVSGGELLTLIRVADHADNAGVCWPGEESLAEYTSQDDRTIRRHLKKLEKNGLLHRERQAAERGRGRAKDRICLHLDQPAKLSGKKSDDQPDTDDRLTGHSEHFQPDTDDTALYREPPENPQRTKRAGEIVVTDKATATWEAAKAELADRLPAETFAKRIRPLEVVGESDGALVLQDSTEHGGGAWVDEQLRPLLFEAIAEFDVIEIVDSTEVEDRGLVDVPPEQRVFDAWLKTWEKGPRTELSPERLRVIRKALASFPVEDVVDAVRGGRFSAHHRGENPQRKPYTHLKYFIGDADRIEEFRDQYRRQAPGARQGLADPALERITRRSA